MTVKEIAGLAGVSIGTVDRVLYRRGRVSGETRARVEAIIEQYQFTPNPIARRLKRNRAYHFCALIPQREQDSGYWGQALEGIQSGAGEIAPLGIETEVVEFNRYNPRSFRAAAASVLEKNPEGIIFPPIMPNETRRFIAAVEDKHIPYVFFDADIPGTAPLCVIGQDSLRGGYLAGRLMHLFAGTITGSAAVLDIHGEDYHITRRRDGFLKYAREHHFAAVVREYSDFKGTELSKEDIRLFLREYPDLQGIFITNSSAHRIVETVKHIRKRRNFFIIAYDLIPNNHALLREGLIDAIISQRPEIQGRRALLDLYRHIVLGRRIAPKVEIPLDVYIKENAPADLIPAGLDMTDEAVPKLKL
ncbi:MAG: LacI family DNA-binding transcriptional regulator [Treponema sp.]|jgi:LacI family transcriptional regulator|nr:LacI family DNA-binding transcriptional regulator [Treponema sp.]